MDQETAEILERMANLLEITYYKAVSGGLAMKPLIFDDISRLREDIAKLAGGDSNDAPIDELRRLATWRPVKAWTFYTAGNTDASKPVRATEHGPYDHTPICTTGRCYDRDAESDQLRVELAGGSDAQ